MLTRKRGAGLVRRRKVRMGIEATHGQNHLLQAFQSQIVAYQKYKIFTHCDMKRVSNATHFYFFSFQSAKQKICKKYLVFFCCFFLLTFLFVQTIIFFFLPFFLFHFFFSFFSFSFCIFFAVIIRQSAY